MALRHSEPTTLFQEASCSLTSLEGQPARTPGLPRSPKAQVPPTHTKQVEATWRYPPYKQKSMSPTLGTSGISGPPPERWQRKAGGVLRVSKCNQVPAALDLPCHLPTASVFLPVLRKGGKTDIPSWYHLEVKVSMTVAFGS